MESIRKVICGTYCRASRNIPSTASTNYYPGMSRRNSANVHLALPNKIPILLLDVLRLTLTIFRCQTLVAITKIHHYYGCSKDTGHPVKLLVLQRTQWDPRNVSPAAQRHPWTACDRCFDDWVGNRASGRPENRTCGGPGRCLLSSAL